jgi:hypothetical protein
MAACRLFEYALAKVDLSYVVTATLLFASFSGRILILHCINVLLLTTFGLSETIMIFLDGFSCSSVAVSVCLCLRLFRCHYYYTSCSSLINCKISFGK